jgi:hypothetical protein
MIRRAALFLIIAICSAEATNSVSSPLASHAVRAVIDEFFAANVYEIEVINFGADHGKAEETIDKLLRLGIPSMPMKISKATGEHSGAEFKLSKPSILLFDSPENFDRNAHRIVFQHGRVVFHPHLVYIRNATIEDIQVVSNKSYTIDKTIFLVNETRHSIELATSFMFTPDACYKNQFKVINRFMRRQHQWENSNFFVEKYKNFHGCPLDFGMYNNTFLDKELNYSVKLSRKNVLVNETMTFSMIQMLKRKSLEGNWFLVSIIPNKIYIPPGKLYGEYEKMFLPFDRLTWIAIAVTVLVSILTIFVIKFKPIWIQNAIFGEGNRSPLMNLISILINGSQHGNLTQNAPRICLMTFLFWSLIFR